MKYIYAHQEDGKSARCTPSSWKAVVLCEMSGCSWDGCVRLIDKRIKSFKSVSSSNDSSDNFQSRFSFNRVLGPILVLIIIYCMVVEIADSLYTSQKMHIILFITVFFQASLNYSWILTMYWIALVSLLSISSDPLLEKVLLALGKVAQLIPQCIGDHLKSPGAR